MLINISHLTLVEWDFSIRHLIYNFYTVYYFRAAIYIWVHELLNVEMVGWVDGQG